jgi:hypothetical protein
VAPAGSPRIHPLAEGRPIFTRDGVRIGKVGELKPPFMKVRGLTGPDYWLPTWTIYSTSTLVVTMSFRSEQLADFALAAFPAA